MPYTSGVLWRFCYVFPFRGCALFVSFLSQTKHYSEQECSKTEREKGQQNHPVAVKGFQRSYVRNARAGAFHRGKMPSFALVALAPGPTETRGTRSSEWCLALREQLFCACKTSHRGCNAERPTAQHKAGEKHPNQQQQKTSNALPIQSHYPYNLSAVPHSEEWTPQGETLYFEDYIVQKYFITWQRHPHSTLASRQIYSLREKKNILGAVLSHEEEKVTKWDKKAQMHAQFQF